MEFVHNCFFNSDRSIFLLINVCTINFLSMTRDLCALLLPALKVPIWRILKVKKKYFDFQEKSPPCPFGNALSVLRLH